MAHRGPFQPLPFCDSAQGRWTPSLAILHTPNSLMFFSKNVMKIKKKKKRDDVSGKEKFRKLGNNVETAHENFKITFQ